MNINELTERVIGCAIEVHRILGPGLLESTYERCLARELKMAGISHELQAGVPIEYKGIHIDCGYRVDVLVEESLILELKSIEKVTDMHKAQLLTYMKLAGVKAGLLINFNVRLLKEGIQRFVL